MGEEPAQLLAAVRCARDRVIVLLGLYCGLRVSEIVGLRVEDLDLGRGMLQVRHGKGDKDRALPIPSKLVPELRAWCEGRTGWLFPSPASAAKHLTSRAVQMSIKAAAARAGIVRRVTPHKLRHTAATKLLRSGMDIICLRDFLGHSSVSTTQIYTASDPEYLRSGVEKLDFGNAPLRAYVDRPGLPVSSAAWKSPPPAAIAQIEASPSV